MAILYHWLGQQHPLVRELDALQQRQAANFLARQRLRRGLPALGLYAGCDLDALDVQDERLQGERQRLVGQLAALDKPQNQQHRRATRVLAQVLCRPGGRGWAEADNRQTG